MKISRVLNPIKSRHCKALRSSANWEIELELSMPRARLNESWKVNQINSIIHCVWDNFIFNFMPLAILLSSIFGSESLLRLPENGFNAHQNFKNLCWQSYENDDSGFVITKTFDYLSTSQNCRTMNKLLDLSDKTFSPLSRPHRFHVHLIEWKILLRQSTISGASGRKLMTYVTFRWAHQELH